MGSGRWEASTYNERANARSAAGKDAFDYSHASRSSGWRVHQTLDPRGMRIRESRDSAEHPDSNSIIIALDVTGSMDKVVRGIHSDLPRLHELLLGHHYIPHPQIMFTAVGDATCDRVPLQVGQFESDNRMDQNLENMILEGGGGGQNTESYELTLYLAARHTAFDAWDKRRRKGYLFMIGDEMAYPAVKAAEVNAIIAHEIQTDIPLPEIIAEVRQRYHLYFLIPGGASHGGDKAILDFWNQHVGPQSVIQLDDPRETSQCIGMAIGINEGSININDGIEEMRKRGMTARTIESVIGAGGPVTRPNSTRRL